MQGEKQRTRWRSETTQKEEHRAGKESYRSGTESCRSGRRWNLRINGLRDEKEENTTDCRRYRREDFSTLEGEDGSHPGLCAPPRAAQHQPSSTDHHAEMNSDEPPNSTPSARISTYALQKISPKKTERHERLCGRKLNKQGRQDLKPCSEVPMPSLMDRESHHSQLTWDNESYKQMSFE